MKRKYKETLHRAYKASAIAQELINLNIACASRPWGITLHLWFKGHYKIRQMQSTPAKFFKPNGKIDKRKLKRWKNKTLKIQNLSQ